MYSQRSLTAPGYEAVFSSKHQDITIMRKYIKEYRGARIYEASHIDESIGKPMGIQLFAKAKLPKEGQLSVDFIEKADTREKAMTQLEHDIDDYLQEHALDSFVSSESNK